MTVRRPEQINSENAFSYHQIVHVRTRVCVCVYMYVIVCIRVRFYVSVDWCVRDSDEPDGDGVVRIRRYVPARDMTGRRLCFMVEDMFLFVMYKDERL